MTHTKDCDISAPTCQKLHTGSQDRVNGYIRMNTRRYLSSMLELGQAQCSRKQVSTSRYEQQCAQA